MIQFELDIPLTELYKEFGHSKAKRAYKRSFKAVADLGKLIAKHDIDASWQARQALYLAGNEMGFEVCRPE